MRKILTVMLIFGLVCGTTVTAAINITAIEDLAETIVDLVVAFLPVIVVVGVLMLAVGFGRGMLRKSK